MHLKLNFPSLLKFKLDFIKIIFIFAIYLNLSLFVSYGFKLNLLLFIFILFFLKRKIIKIFFINLFFLTLFLKIITFIFPLKDPFIETVYEKKFLYGIKNKTYKYFSYSGDLIQKSNTQNKLLNKKILIKNDNLGFRNDIDFLDQDIVLVGDSFLHNLRINQSELIQSILKKKYGINAYNASLSTYNVSHYLEVIKFLKNKNTNAKFVMFIFSGNDYLNYQKPISGYGVLLDNFALDRLMKIKKFFNFYSYLSYYRAILKENEFSNKILEIKNNLFKQLFYRDYIDDKVPNISFTNDYQIYKDTLPNLIIVLPRKKDVYCNFYSEFDCNQSDYYFRELEKNNLFRQTRIVDSTQYLRKKAEDLYMSQKKFIYDFDDTHLNSEGINLLSDYVASILNDSNFDRKIN